MFIRRCMFLLILAGVALLVGPWRLAQAGDGWLPIDPADLKMTSDPKAPGAPAIYLYRQVDRNDADKATSEMNYVRIKILTEEGRENANVQIPFRKQRTSVSNIRARTIHPDGSIVNFDGKVFESTIVKSKTLKYLAKTFTMPDVTVGSIIEYRYNYNFDDNYIFDSEWILSEELFTRHAQFTLKPYGRNGYSVEWQYPAGLPLGTQPAQIGADRIIQMTADNVPAFPTEDYMPPENELKFRVKFVYYDELPETDVDKYWRKFGKKESGRVEGFVDKRKAMEEAVAQIVSPGDAPEVKLQKIYARTQKIRNLSYEPRKSEEELKREKMKPASNVEDIWKDGYGSGSGITWVFLGLARAAGFEAYPCLVSGRSEYFFHKERRNSRELDANVVLVKVNGKDMYFDPGAAYTPYGLLPWMETGVNGLRLDREGGTWIMTPVPDSSVNRIERAADVKLLDDGSVEGKLKVTYSGLEALSRRLTERNQDETERKNYLETEVQEAIPTGSEVELTNKPEWSSSDISLVAEYTIKVPGWASSAGKKLIFPTGLFGGSEKHLFEHSDRVHPVYFIYPFTKSDTVNVGLPLGWKVGSLPAPIDEDAKAAEFKLKVGDQGGNLQVHRELRSDLTLIPVNAYGSLRMFYQIMRKHDDEQIVLQPGGAAAGK
jgi:hypothetical protein